MRISAENQKKKKSRNILKMQMPPSFYQQPVLHLNCAGRIEVENCRAILDYTSEVVRLDMGRWDVIIKGTDFMLEGVAGRVVQIKGKIFATEILYKEADF